MAMWNSRNSHRRITKHGFQLLVSAISKSHPRISKGGKAKTSHTKRVLSAVGQSRRDTGSSSHARELGSKRCECNVRLRYPFIKYTGRRKPGGAAVNSNSILNSPPPLSGPNLPIKCHAEVMSQIIDYSIQVGKVETLKQFPERPG